MKKSAPAFHAFTIQFNGIADKIITDVVLAPAFDPQSPPNPLPAHYKTTALWDTGATKSVITAETVKAMNLQAIGKTVVNHAGGSGQSEIYILNFLLPNKVGIAGIVATECPFLINNAGAIIGMDIISQGDFSITNANGKTCMTYRFPSVEKIDYVEDAKKIRFAGIGRNDPCPCGKTDQFGKPMKYKKCCGSKS